METIKPKWIKIADIRDTIDPTWSKSSHEIATKYFYKMYNRIPTINDIKIIVICYKIYEFEFNMWAKGMFNYNAMSKHNKPKHKAWVERQLANQSI